MSLDPCHYPTCSCLFFSTRSSPCLVLLPVGFALPVLSPEPRCALTAPFHPYLIPEGPSAVCFLWHCPDPCEWWALPTTVSCGARTFLHAGCPAQRSLSPLRTWVVIIRAGDAGGKERKVFSDPSSVFSPKEVAELHGILRKGGGIDCTTIHALWR